MLDFLKRHDVQRKRKCLVVIDIDIYHSTDMNHIHTYVLTKQRLEIQLEPEDHRDEQWHDRERPCRRSFALSTPNGFTKQSFKVSIADTHAIVIA